MRVEKLPQTGSRLLTGERLTRRDLLALGHGGVLA
jgi:hypothetical protein